MTGQEYEEDHGTDPTQEMINPTAGTPIRLGTFEWVISRIRYGPSLTWPMFRRKAWEEGAYLGTSDGPDGSAYGGYLAVLIPVWDDSEDYDGLEIVRYREEPLTYEDILADDWERIRDCGLWEWEPSGTCGASPEDRED